MGNMRPIVSHNHKAPQKEFQDLISLLMDNVTDDSQTHNHINIPITFQVTADCNLKCSYCYQINKCKKRMSFDTAKKAVDIILTDTHYCNAAKKKSVVLDFIGGEPLLEIDLIEEIYKYFICRCIELNHPWLYTHRISICTNGLLYFDKRVQNFIQKHKDVLSLTITIDGPKSVHDSCRVLHDGSGSYDIVSKAVKHLQDFYGDGRDTKVTLCPENVRHLGDIVNHFTTEFKFNSIHANCVFEHEWSTEDCIILFDEMIKLADYIYENDLYDKLIITLFDEQAFHPVDYSIADNNKNWCGGCGDMLAVNHSGNFYPCLRYMESSLGDDINPIIIGDIDNGIMYSEDQCKVCKTLWNTTVTSQSDDKCITCPVADGCAWCSAYNYQYTGKLNKRVTKICMAHKVRAIANVYYWNKFYNIRGIKVCYENYLPEEECIELIGEERYNLVKSVLDLQNALITSSVNEEE